MGMSGEEALFASKKYTDKKVAEGGGGGTGGTSNYNDLDSKPSINGVTLLGNKTADNLKLVSKDEDGNISVEGTVDAASFVNKKEYSEERHSGSYVEIDSKIMKVVEENGTTSSSMTYYNSSDAKKTEIYRSGGARGYRKNTMDSLGMDVKSDYGPSAFVKVGINEDRNIGEVVAGNSYAKTTIDGNVKTSGDVCVVKPDGETSVSLTKVNNDLHDLSFGENSGSSNLFKPTLINTWQCNCTIDSNDKITLTSTGTSGVSYARIGTLNLKANKKYTFNILEKNGDTLSVQLYKDNSTYLTSFGSTQEYTPSENMNVTIFGYVAIGSGKTCNFKLMVTTDGVHTSYEPYIMSNKQLTEVNVSLDEQGLLNVFDKQIIQGYYDTNRTEGNPATNTTYVTTKNPIIVSNAKKLSFSYNGKSVNNCFVQFYDNSGANAGAVVLGNIGSSYNGVVDVLSGAKTAHINFQNTSGYSPTEFGYLSVYIDNKIDKVNAALTQKSTIVTSADWNGNIKYVKSGNVVTMFINVQTISNSEVKFEIPEDCKPYEAVYTSIFNINDKSPIYCYFYNDGRRGTIANTASGKSIVGCITYVSL